MLEAEILRLNHLRDRASENGRKKEYPLLTYMYLDFLMKICNMITPSDMSQIKISRSPDMSKIKSLPHLQALA